MYAGSLLIPIFLKIGILFSKISIFKLSKPHCETPEFLWVLAIITRKLVKKDGFLDYAVSKFNSRIFLLLIQVCDIKTQPKRNPRLENQKFL